MLFNEKRKKAIYIARCQRLKSKNFKLMFFIVRGLLLYIINRLTLSEVVIVVSFWARAWGTTDFGFLNRANDSGPKLRSVSGDCRPTAARICGLEE